MPQQKWFNVWAVVCLLFVYLGVGQHKVIPLRPQSVHQWAQCDRASVALNYYQEDMNLFLPRVHNLDNGSGITGLEFPFVNYSVAILYKVFGYHEWMYRTLMLLIFSFGMISLAKIIMHYLNSNGIALGMMCLYAATPLLSFYTANFIPDIAALSFFLISWWILVNAKGHGKRKIVLWTICFCLAALIKITILIFLPAMLFVVFKDEQLVKQRKHFIFGVSLSVVLVFAWYYYASLLSKSTGSEVFLLRIVILKSWAEFIDVFQEIKTVWMPRLYHPYLTLTLFSFPLISFLLTFKKSQFDYVSILVWLGTICFLFLMWPQLRHHDYYMITLSLVFILSFMLICKKLIERNVSKKYVTIAMFVFGAFQVTRAHDYFTEVYNKENWQYGIRHADLYFDLEAELRASGVKLEDPIISVYDHTPNVSLYLMNQKGVSVSFRGPRESIPAYLVSGQFKYLVYNPFSEYGNAPFNPEEYPLKFFAEMDGMKVYSVNSYHKEGTLKRFNLTPWN